MSFLAIDIGGSKFRTAIAAVDGGAFRLLHVSQRSLASDCTMDALLDLIDRSVNELDMSAVERIGVTIPGLTDPKAGTWIYAPFSGIRNFPMAKHLSERYGGKPVFVENDVNACALAERSFGICKKTTDFLWMTVSNGIGGGLVLGGNIYAGHFGNAGEIGHFCATEHGGFRCGCGNYGCLEAEAAGPGISKRYAERLKNLSELRKEAISIPMVAFSAEKIAELARFGDEIAISVFEYTGSLIGKAASYAVNLLNLEKVVIGGGVSQSFDLLLPSMEASFRAKIFRDANPRVSIEQTGLGLEAGLAGAVAIAMQ